MRETSCESRFGMGTISYIPAREGRPFFFKACENAVHARKPHFHAELSFALVEQGSSIADVCGRRYLVTAPFAMLIPAGMAHSCRPCDPSSWRFRMAYIDLTNWGVNAPPPDLWRRCFRKLPCWREPKRPALIRMRSYRSDLVPLCMPSRRILRRIFYGVFVWTTCARQPALQSFT